MGHVALRVSSQPAQVRVVRLVATAVARRAGLDAESLDEVRLAVAEACGLALEADRTARAGAPITVDFDDDPGLVVTVHAAGDVRNHGPELDLAEGRPDRLAVLQGLLEDDVAVSCTDAASTIRMAWGRAT
ncbi:MAG: ATP-binding protein [Actinomycetota bacterium]|nr:ATP-binding protein [Actinomycetota bacterium]